MKSSFRLGGSALLCAILFSTLGCGPPDYYKCSGVVTKDGEPVPWVQIRFAPDEIDAVRPPIGIADINGQFEMKSARKIGVPPGSYTVHIFDPAADDGGQTIKPGDDHYENYSYVVDRYSPDKSDLKYTADSHQTSFELKLDTKEYTGPEIKAEVMENTTDTADE
ncbi:MAG: hypothetical protein AAF483_14595 [Planctomycetota bacterium]